MEVLASGPSQALDAYLPVERLAVQVMSPIGLEK
jgi:hypothetical protein